MERTRILIALLSLTAAIAVFHVSPAHAQRLQKSLNGKFSSANILSEAISPGSTDKKRVSIRSQDTLFEEIARDRPDLVVIEEFSDSLGDSSFHGDSNIHYDQDARDRKANRIVKRIAGREIDSALRSGQLASYYKTAKKTASKMNNMVEVKKEHSSMGFEYIPRITAGIDVPSGFNPSMRIGKNARMYYDWSDQTTRIEIGARW